MESNIKVVIKSDNNLIIKEIKIENEYEIGTIIISPITFDKFLFENYNFGIKKILLLKENENGFDLVKNKNEDIYIYKSFNKIKIENELFCISGNGQFSILNYDKPLNDSEKSLYNCFEKNYLRQIIVLDNKNIVANISSHLISYYKYSKSKYDKYFNNINKYYKIIDLCKLNNNCFCFLSKSEWEESPIILSMFNENFACKEIQIRNIKKNEEISNHILFRINNDNLVIIGESGFIILNISNFEIVTIIETYPIYCSLKFTKENPNLEIYEYLAIIVKKNNTFFLQIYKFIDNNFEVSNEFNLCEYSSQIKKFFDENFNVIKKNDENDNIDNNGYGPDINKFSNSNEILNNRLKSDKITNIKEPHDVNPTQLKIFNFFNNKKKKEDEDEKEKKYEQNKTKDQKEIIEYFDFCLINFDMNYHIRNNGNILLIIGINSFKKKKRLITLLEIDLSKIQFH